MKRIALFLNKFSSLNNTTVLTYSVTLFIKSIPLFEITKALEYSEGSVAYPENLSYCFVISRPITLHCNLAENLVSPG